MKTVKFILFLIFIAPLVWVSKGIYHTYKFWLFRKTIREYTKLSKQAENKSKVLSKNI